MYMNNEGPIPGENFTSDTKNYPWHQPPEFTDLNKALDMLTKKITGFKTANGILTIAELGIPLYRISSMIVMAGVGEGKWTPDFAILLSGPLTKMIEVMCIGFDIEYNVGIDEDETIFTGEFFKAQNELKNRDTNDALKILKEEMPEIKEAAEAQADTGTAPEGDLQSQGFMTMAGGDPSAAEPADGDASSEGMDDTEVEDGVS